MPRNGIASSIGSSTAQALEVVAAVGQELATAAVRYHATTSLDPGESRIIDLPILAGVGESLEVTVLDPSCHAVPHPTAPPRPGPRPTPFVGTLLSVHGIEQAIGPWRPCARHVFTARGGRERGSGHRPSGRFR